MLCGPITAHLGLHYWDGVVTRLLHGARGLALHLVAAEHRHPGLVTQVTRLGLGQSSDNKILNIPFGQSSAKLPVTQSFSHSVTWSLSHLVT